MQPFLHHGALRFNHPGALYLDINAVVWRWSPTNGFSILFALKCSMLSEFGVGKDVLTRFFPDGVVNQFF